MSEPDGIVADLRSYYEREAALDVRRSRTGMRVEIRTDFIELLRNEGRSRVLELGCGPGHDAAAFLEAGIEAVGLDLAVGNAKLGAERGVRIVAGSMAAPPFDRDSFDAGWSMSTLMHVPESEVEGVVAHMVRPLRAGAPLMIGLWGGERRDETDTTNLPGERRLFSLRPLERNAELLSAAGSIESGEIRGAGPEGWEYQIFLIRV